MYISDVSRTSDKYCRDAIKDVNYVYDKILDNTIDIQDSYSYHLLKANKDVAYHIAIILSRLNIINTHTISEIRNSVESGVPFSERDYHEDLANGDDVKRSRKIQVSRRGQYVTHSWIVSNLANKKGNLRWEVSHNGRSWLGIIPKEYFTGQNSLSMACDPQTGEPKRNSPLYQFFKETTV
mgnify:FL=1